MKPPDAAIKEFLRSVNVASPAVFLHFQCDFSKNLMALGNLGGDLLYIHRRIFCTKKRKRLFAVYLAGPLLRRSSFHAAGLIGCTACIAERPIAHNLLSRQIRFEPANDALSC